MQHLSTPQRSPLDPNPALSLRGNLADCFSFSIFESSKCNRTGWHKFHPSLRRDFAFTSQLWKSALGPTEKLYRDSNLPVISSTPDDLAVSRNFAGRGLGADILSDALRRIAVTSQSIGIGAVLVQAKDDRAKKFYLACAEFVEHPTDSRTFIFQLKRLWQSSAESLFEAGATRSGPCERRIGNVNSGARN